MTFSKRQNHSDREQCRLLPRGLGLSCVTIKDAERQSRDNEAIPCWDGDYKNVSVLQSVKLRAVIILFNKCTCTCVHATTGLWKLKGAGSFPSTMWVPRISQARWLPSSLNWSRRAILHILSLCCFCCDLIFSSGLITNVWPESRGWATHCVWILSRSSWTSSTFTYRRRRQ